MRAIPYIKDTNFRNTIKNRFYSYVSLPNENGCMEWRGGLFGNGYGMINIKRKGVLAHRFSYYLHHGKDPKKMFVLHTCDNTKCVAIDHLFLGTQKDNMIDMVNKERGYMKKGLNHPDSALTKKDEEEIKRLLFQKIPQSEIAKIFNVSQGLISHVLIGRNHSIISDEERKLLKSMDSIRRRENCLKKRKLSDKQVKEIRTFISQGLTCTEISKRYSVTRGVINNIKLNKSYLTNTNN